MANTQERLDRQLLNACRYGHVSEVEVLSSKGANIHYSDEDDPFGATCLSEASRRGKAQIVQLLIDQGVSVDDKISHDITALHLACERGHIDVVRVLLDNHAQPSPAELFNLDTPLHYAAANDHDAICALLISHGVDANLRNRTGDTPLHIAVANDRLRATTKLLSLGADLSITNHAEMTPVTVGQLAKCTQAMSAIEPFLDKLAREEQDEKAQAQAKDKQSRKHTIKQMLHKKSRSNTNKGSVASPSRSARSSRAATADSNASLDTDQEDDGFAGKFRNVVSGKRDVVFKKGFLAKQGKKFKHFHERYFILWSNGLMNYYSKEHTVFANYEEKSKEKESAADANGLLSPSLANGNSNGSLDESGDDAVLKTSTPTTPRTKKRRSTLKKLGLKSDVIKPKGTIDVNDLIETQFLEFADNAPGWALITAEREWKFKCASDRERREWIAAVHAVNYGISAFDFQNLGMDIRYQNGGTTRLLEPAQNAFLRQQSDRSCDAAVAQGWMFKMGAAVRGLEQNYWKKRWVSLYKKPARLSYAVHPYSAGSSVEESVASPKSPEMGNDTENEEKVPSEVPSLASRSSSKKSKKDKSVKGVIALKDVTNIIKIGNNELIKEKYRAPTVHVFALITEKRTWVFSCKTAEECAMWYDRISFFLPNQWKAQSEAEVDVEELLRFNRVKTMADGGGGGDAEEKDGNSLKVKKGGDEDTVMSKILRKVSNAGERLGIIEQYSTISGVQPKGMITDYDDGVNAIGNDAEEQDVDNAQVQ